jgi:hypothetical protein
MALRPSAVVRTLPTANWKLETTGAGASVFMALSLGVRLQFQSVSKSYLSVT